MAAWVDGSAVQSGDGSRERPFRTVAEALAQNPSRIDLQAGLYPGPFRVEGPQMWVAHGAVVLTGDRHAPVVDASGPLTLESVQIQGGGVRLAKGGVLRGVELAGALGPEVVVVGGAVFVSRTRFSASFSDAVGLRVESRAICERCTFEGPFRRAIEVTGNASVQGAAIAGAYTAVRVESGFAELVHVAISSGRGPAIDVKGGSVELHDVSISDHDVALGTAEGSIVEGDELTTSGSLELEGSARLHRLAAHGAVSRGDVELDDAWLGSLSVTRGELILDQGFVEDTEVTGAKAMLLGLSGSRLTAKAGARVGLVDGVLRRGGIEVESLAQVRARSVDLTDCDGPGFLVPSKAFLVADVVRLARCSIPVWAECGNDARVYLSRVRSEAPVPESACVELR